MGNGRRKRKRTNPLVEALGTITVLKLSGVFGLSGVAGIVSDCELPILALRTTVDVGRFLNAGAGKLLFLSMASTVRWKRRKSASARMRVDSRSIVVESSFAGVISTCLE